MFNKGGVLHLYNYSIMVPKNASQNLERCFL